MGREIKRVPLGFEYDLNKVWVGYLNPYASYGEKCPECDGSGYSKKAKHLSDQWYGNAPFKPEDRGCTPWTPENETIKWLAERNTSHNSMHSVCNKEFILKTEVDRLCDFFNSHWAYNLNDEDVCELIKANRLVDFTHTWTKKDGWKRDVSKKIPSAQEVNEWSIKTLGHDSINSYIVIEAECKRLGYPHSCIKCNGNGSVWPSATIKRRYDRWKRVEPPEGKGFQLWETVSEGSPISPVFKTPEELATWLVESPDYSWRQNDAGTTYEDWLAFIKQGWAMSLFSDGKTVMSGVRAVSKLKN